MYFGVWVLKLIKLRPATPIETFARFQAGFLSSEDFHRFLSIVIDFCWKVWFLGFVGSRLEAWSLTRSTLRRGRRIDPK